MSPTTGQALSTPNRPYRTEYTPPPPPDPAADLGLKITPIDPDSEDRLPLPSNLDIFTLPPVTALKLLCSGIEALVRVTGDIPPTPPSSTPTTPNMRGMQAEKENIVRSHSFTDLSQTQRYRTPSRSSRGFEEIDGVTLRRTSFANLGPDSKGPYVVIGENAEPLNLQHSAITRKFYSKKQPTISVEDYLMRIHKFCPMSTAVYLATSLYIHRLAVEERAIPVTRRNCHRLLLAGLRVAMKALEDLSYPHGRFSRVGGVNETELARLEISFCFLTNFDLRTTKEMLLKHTTTLKQIHSAQGAIGGNGLDFLRASAKSKRRSAVLQESATEITADA